MRYPLVARFFPGVLVGVGILGCAAGPTAVQSTRETGKPDCFYAHQAESFHVLDQSNLIVYAPNDANAFHVHIAPPSPDLRSSESLAFTPPDGRICGYAGQQLLVADATFRRAYSVLDVARLSPEGLRDLLNRPESGPAASARPTAGRGAQVEPVSPP